jgi:putative component of membrane protein insertase Oxa1/YidC/SpoIIIJ protein YidD
MYYMTGGSFVVVSFYHWYRAFRIFALCRHEDTCNGYVIVHSVQFSDVETWLRHSLCMLLLQGVQLLLRRSSAYCQH